MKTDFETFMQPNIMWQICYKFTSFVSADAKTAEEIYKKKLKLYL